MKSYQGHDSVISEDGVGRIYLEDIFIESTKHFLREVKVYDNNVKLIWKGTLEELIRKLRGAPTVEESLKVITEALRKDDVKCDQEKES